MATAAYDPKRAREILAEAMEGKVTVKEQAQALVDLPREDLQQVLNAMIRREA